MDMLKGDGEPVPLLVAGDGVPNAGREDWGDETDIGEAELGGKIE